MERILALQNLGSFADIDDLEKGDDVLCSGTSNDSKSTCSQTCTVQQELDELNW